MSGERVVSGATKRQRRDKVVAALCGVLGLAVVVAAWRLPPGIGNLPGPGFFPAVLGALILGFAALLGYESRHPKPDGDERSGAEPDWRLPGVAMLLMLAYVGSWELVPFLVRTPVLIAVLMRLSGATWRSVLLAAILFPLSLYGVFTLGLRVDLG